MAKKRTIYSALPIVAAAYGEKFGVRVAIGHDIASTDGQTIVVPNVPEDYPHKDAVWGYLAHEAAHVRFTDFTVRRRKGLHTALSNILEDCRIERAMMGLYPGTRHTLNEVARYMAHAGHYWHVTEKEPPASILSGYCLYWLQTKAVGQWMLQDYLDSARAVFERKFPQGVIVRLNALLRKAVELKSTASAASLATEIIKMIEEEKEKEAQKPRGDGAQNQFQAGGGDQDQDDQRQSHQDDHGGDDPKGQGRQGKGGDGQTQTRQDISGSDDSGKPDAARLLQQVLDADGDELRGDAHESLRQELNQAAKDKGDDRYLTVRTAVDTQNSPAVGKQLISAVKSTTAKIRTQLYGLVQASQRVATRNHRAGKRVDSRRLHRIAIGDTRVFLKPEPKIRPNTAIHILVDMSSSMRYQAANGKQRQDIAREAALALSLALEAIPGANPAVTFFGGDRYRPVFSAIRHGERVQSQAGKFGFRATGTTPMAEAIWYASFELSKTREERKMLIVVSDGDPDNAAACHSIIDLCKGSGIEPIGIGVESTAVASLFDKNIVIKDAAALQRTLFKLMERSLTAA